MNPQQTPTPPAQPAAADPRQQVLQQIKTGTNVLLTVSENPTVDQLAAVIGMTILLNKLGKHATAVFSGEIPSTIEFLQPEKTLEKTTDSLRDFIISLDKTKADKLRYKVEDKYVKIFITPYHTSLSDKDLEFSQGDFNVDVVLALGVKKRDELDETIVSHGRILHDATVISINNTPGADIGAINWTQTTASGLSEMMVGLAEDLKTEQQKLLDEQISTCFLTGIVAQTDRFSNAKTSPQTMSLAAKLMNAGANQQLIATKLQPPAVIPKEPEKFITAPELPKPVAPPKPAPQPPAGPPATKPIPTTPAPPPPHAAPAVKAVATKPAEEPKPAVQEESQDGALLVPHEGVTGDGVAYQNGPEENISKIHIDDQGLLKRVVESDDSKPEDDNSDEPKPPATGGLTGENRKIVDKPPGTDAAPAAGTQNNATEPSTDPLNLPDVKAPTVDSQANANPIVAPAPADATIHDKETLSDLEKSVNSPHQNQVDDKGLVDNMLPVNLIGPDKGLPQDQTAGSDNPTPPPPVPPPLPIPAPPNFAPGNMSNPNSGVPL